MMPASLSSFKRNRFIKVPLTSTVSHLGPRFAYILDNYRHARIQGRRQCCCRCCCSIPLLVIVCWTAKLVAGSLNMMPASLSSFKRNLFFKYPLAVHNCVAFTAPICLSSSIVTGIRGAKADVSAAAAAAALYRCWSSCVGRRSLLLVH